MFYSVILFLTIIGCNSAHLLPRDVKDLTELQTQKVDSPQNSLFPKKNLTALRSPKPNPSDNITSTNTTPPKKWKVDRFTRKQYEIINLLWRKTKVFVNVEVTTLKPHLKTTHKPFFKPTSSKTRYNLTKSKENKFDIPKENPFILSARSPILSSTSTPSYIEFYYSDETDDNVHTTSDFNYMYQLKVTEKLNMNMLNTPNSSFLVFHIKGPPVSVTTKLFYSNKSNSHSVKFVPKSHEENHSMYLTTSMHNNSDLISRKLQTESTTVYDKIKFFEMYDKNTRIPHSKKESTFQFDYEQSEEEIKTYNNIDKILLEHIDQSSHQHNESKHSKKHIVENNNNFSHPSINSLEENSTPKTLLNVTTVRQNNVSLYIAKGSIVKSEIREFKNIYSYINKSVSWSTYPFAAVYVYEPSQVRCDAASVSAHWLVASGSCLSRLNEGSVLGDGRSAFVAYCGDTWWQPERVSYVKYTLVHPRYHPRDHARRHLYNIGVIQVVTSMMSACSEWAPVTLMSHQFAANQGGSEASALGWGLDRYDTRYSAVELPKTTLSLYKGLVFLDYCPGNTRYSKLKQLGDRGLKNVYCLSLPPYSGEERDPIHGGLLLAGGKLIALYLQEERRPWGEQSAQYTGVWDLIQWVADVAKEPDEMELFTDEI